MYLSIYMYAYIYTYVNALTRALTTSDKWQTNDCINPLMCWILRLSKLVHIGHVF